MKDEQKFGCIEIHEPFKINEDNGQIFKHLANIAEMKYKGEWTLRKSSAMEDAKKSSSPDDSTAKDIARNVLSPYNDNNKGYKNLEAEKLLEIADASIDERSSSIKLKKLACWLEFIIRCGMILIAGSLIVVSYYAFKKTLDSNHTQVVQDVLMGGTTQSNDKNSLHIKKTTNGSSATPNTLDEEVAPPKNKLPEQSNNPMMTSIDALGMKFYGGFYSILVLVAAWIVVKSEVKIKFTK